MSNETGQEIPVNVSGAETAEPPEAPVETGAPATPEAQLAQLRAEADRYRDHALRTQADHDNYRKRATREKEEAVRYANLDLLERLIPILDNFELGLSAARTSAEGGAI